MSLKRQRREIAHFICIRRGEGEMRVAILVDVVVELVLHQGFHNIEQVHHQVKLFEDNFSKDNHAHQHVEDVVQKGVKGGIHSIVHVKALAGKHGECHRHLCLDFV